MTNLSKGHFSNDLNNLKYSKELDFWASAFHKARVSDFGHFYSFIIQ